MIFNIIIKNVKSRVVIAIAPCFLLLTLTLSAQKIEIGGGFNALIYQGDLSSDMPLLNFSSYNPGGNLFLRHNVSKESTLRYSLMVGRLSAKGSKSPNVYISNDVPQSFSTPIYEFSALYEYNFFDYRYERFRRASPYLVAGLGAMYFNPQVTEPGGSALPIQVVLPFGIGLKYILHKKWNLGFELQGRKVFTDYLDNVSDQNAAGWQTGEAYNQDWYMHFMVSLSYTIYRIPCPFDYY